MDFVARPAAVQVAPAEARKLGAGAKTLGKALLDAKRQKKTTVVRGVSIKAFCVA